MQSSWRRDADKLTFIICTSPHTPQALSDVSIPIRVTGKIDDTPNRMIGDVNLFLYPSEDCNDGAGEQGKHETGEMDAVGELEIMIARPDARGKGLAKEALQAFIWYISTSLPAILDEYAKGANNKDKPKSLSYLRVRIDKDNIPSLSLFKTLGFSQVSEPNYFGEVELRSEIARHGIDKACLLAKSVSYED